MSTGNLPNILLIILDSARAKNTSLHGYHRDTTPFLEKFSANSTVYYQARSPGIHSVASHASIWTGQHVEEHGATEHESILPIDQMVWTKLKKEFGYSTGLFTPNAVVSHASNLSAPFDIAVDYASQSRRFDRGPHPFDYSSQRTYIRDAIQSRAPIQSLLNGFFYKYAYGGIGSETGDKYIDKLITWIDDQSGKWAACLNILEPHAPYRPKQEFDRWSDHIHHQVHEELDGTPFSKTFTEPDSELWKLQALESLYDGSIRQADAFIERLISKLHSLNEFENTLLVITSDHGEGFGEQSRVEPKANLIDHSWGIDEEVTHVPLVVKYPDQENGDVIKKPATIRRFPQVVDAVLNNREKDSTFVPDGPVLCSTFRLQQHYLDNYPNIDMSPYLGPWRAVYTWRDGRIVKYAARQKTAVEIGIEGTEELYVDDANYEIIDQYFDDKIEERSNTRTSKISADIEEKLRDLGYVR